MRTVYLISCVARKGRHPGPARDLYESAWFKRARAYVEAQRGEWFILSALHGLIAPEVTIDPYSETLNQMPIRDRRAWADRVARQLVASLDSPDRVVVLAGKRYREFLMEPLRRIADQVEIPMEGLGIGEQLRWLTLNTPKRVRLADLRRFYEILAELEIRVGGMRRLLDCDARSGWPGRGVYFFFEEGERRSDSGEGLRVVRVGTHAVSRGAGTTLWKRLAQHRGTVRTGGGNHRGSVFRRIVGSALIRSGEVPGSETWGHGNSAPKHVRVEEHPIEVAVSTKIRAMPFLWLRADDPAGRESVRAFIEQNAIALLSNHARPSFDPPSTGWLGQHCAREKMPSSGLWNSDHVEKIHDPAFLDQLQHLAERT